MTMIVRLLAGLLARLMKVERKSSLVSPRTFSDWISLAFCGSSKISRSAPMPVAAPRIDVARRPPRLVVFIKPDDCFPDANRVSKMRV